MIQTYFLFSYPVLGAEGNLQFSHKHGFYEEPFELTISCDIEGAEILYTLDGKDPRYAPGYLNANSPVKILIDPSIILNRDNAPGFIVTACGVNADRVVTDLITQTYLFANKVTELSPDGFLPGPEWLNPLTTSQRINYGMDPDIYEDPLYKTEINEALFSIPSLSLVTDLNNLFDPDTGIYVNASKHGREWERRASLELINPDGSEGFQINCGIRIRGGWSRHDDCPKRPFRIFFRSEYGKGKLEYPLFGDEGADKFDNVDLRTSVNYSWAYYGDSQNTFMRDIFSRDTQKDMGQPYTRSRFYHLYINGTYWGLYQTQERADASYGETYFEGSMEDFDVIKVDVGEYFNVYNIEATDGNTEAWKKIWDAGEAGFYRDEDYFRMLGLNPDGSPNPSYPNLIDPDNLIDYMICTFFAGDFDGPISGFSGNNNPNNFFAIYNRNNPQGFKFFRHDAEHSLFYNSWGTDRTGPYPAGEYFPKSNPQWFHQKLSANRHYRQRFGDRVYKHFFNDGALTLENNRNRISNRSSQIDKAIIAESARWGDSSSRLPLTKKNWEEAVDFITDQFLKTRTQVVLGQFTQKDLFSGINIPEFNTPGGIVEKGYSISLNNYSGKVYYTLDNKDPYDPFNPAGNFISKDAIEYQGGIIIYETARIKARSYENSKFSPLNEAVFSINEDLSPVKITELHYHPLNEDTTNDTEYEFIELKNTGDSEINLNASGFTDGILFTFGTGSLIPPKGFIVLASNAVEFKNRYGFEPFGEYEGQLNNGGEKILFSGPLGDTLISFSYKDNDPWPPEADGAGYSLVTKRIDPLGWPGYPSYWKISGTVHGSPGTDDIVSDVENEEEAAPAVYKLNQNYPNPFNPTTTISYEIPSKLNSGTTHELSLPQVNVKLIIYDILGRQIATLVNESQSPGQYKIEFDATGLTSGIYFYRLQLGNTLTNSGQNFIQTKKMILLR